MDEAERCNGLAYIAYGNLLIRGAVDEVIAFSHLKTWSVSGPDLRKLAHELRGEPGVEQAVAFGNPLHISGSDPAALEAAIAPYRKEGYEWRQVQSGLEDAFIHLMDVSKDNYSL